jgi:hypothetical protein
LNDKVQDKGKEKVSQLTDEDEAEEDAYSNIKEALEKTKETGNLLLLLLIIFVIFCHPLFSLLI